MTTEEELWHLFFTPDMLDLLVEHTNANIREDFEVSKSIMWIRIRGSSSLGGGGGGWHKMSKFFEVGSSRTALLWSESVSE